MNFLNIGILAHVDAGKTSLTERLLFNAGVIDYIGSVDAGNTQTDSLSLERQRGITIKTAAVSFELGNTTVNLLDTPGHPDFIAEVERVLNVLDGAVLVISAVEGVQAQTRILMRTLQRLKIPTIIFVNKIDRRGARYDDLLDDIAEKLTPAIAPAGTASGLGKPDADFVPYKINKGTIVGMYPVFAGSAITGAGVETLAKNLTELLPVAKGNANGRLSGTVFKIERSAGEKIAYVRVFNGAIHLRQTLQFGNANEGKVTSINVFDHGKTVGKDVIIAGEIGKLSGLGSIRIGDTIGSPTTRVDHYFAPPTLETAVVSLNASNKASLHAALTQLAEQDPLINLRQDESNQLLVSLYGEVQKEVIQSTLADDFGIDVTFRASTPIYIERPVGVGKAELRLQSMDNPTSATVGLTIQPGPPGSGIEFRLKVDQRLVPMHIYKTVGNFKRHMHEYVVNALAKGPLGWKVTDCIVTMNQCDYYVADGLGKPIGDTPKTTAADFRKLTPLVLLTALGRTGTTLCQPILRFEFEIPTSALSAVLAALPKLAAQIHASETHGSVHILQGEIPAARVHELQQQIPLLTGGEGIFESTFARYDAMRKKVE